MSKQITMIKIHLCSCTISDPGIVLSRARGFVPVAPVGTGDYASKFKEAKVYSCQIGVVMLFSLHKMLLSLFKSMCLMFK